MKQEYEKRRMQCRRRKRRIYFDEEDGERGKERKKDRR